jgi:hypothetical protein
MILLLRFFIAPTTTALANGIKSLAAFNNAKDLSTMAKFFCLLSFDVRNTQYLLSDRN